MCSSRDSGVFKCELKGLFGYEFDYVLEGTRVSIRATVRAEIQGYSSKDTTRGYSSEDFDSMCSQRVSVIMPPAST